MTVSCLPVDGDVWVQLSSRARPRARAAEAALDAVGAEVREALGTDC